MSQLKTANILLVEDSEADAELVRFCLKKNKIRVELVVFENGEDALDHVFHSEDEKQFPDLILLDVNLPGMSGIEVLQRLKENQKTKMIPVAILTSSERDEDILKSYSCHANCFLQKPLELSSFQKIINTFEEFWLNIVTLPNYEKSD